MSKSPHACRTDAAGGDETRVLHRLDVREGPTGEGDDTDTHVGIAVHVDTTSTIIDLGAVLRLAVRRFRFDSHGVITHVDRVHEWLEDPGTPLTPEITATTGLTDADVSGQRLDEVQAVRLLRSASIVIAHHAAFDRPHVERRLEGARGLRWACSFRQVDWLARGLDGRTLGYLVQQAGFFYDGHRPGVEADALVQLLRHRFESGGTVLTELIARSALPTWIVRADGAGFASKDRLKERGYRWDPDRRVWWTEVADEARIAEEFWLAQHVYSAGMGTRSMAPGFEKISAAERFL